MLCIIFTKKKILAGIQNETTALLKFEGNTYISYDSSLLAAFQHNHSLLTNAYKCFLTKTGQDFTYPIPIAIIIPLATSPREKKALIEWVKSQHEIFQLSYVGTIQHTYLQALQKEKKLAMTNSILLEALDDCINVSYHFASPSAKNQPHIIIKELGWEKARNHIMEAVITNLAKEGFIIAEEEEKLLYQQLVTQKYPKQFSIHKTKDSCSVQISYALDIEDQKNLATQGHQILEKYISNEILTDKNIYKVILIGDYFDNDIILNYICDHLDIQSKFYAPDIQNDEKVFKRIIKNTFNKEINTQTTLADARLQVRNGIKIPSLEQQHKQTQTIPFISKISPQKPTFRDERPALIVPKINTSSKVHSVTLEPTPSQEENNYKHEDLEKYFQIEELYSNRTFLFFKGQIKSSSKERVFRFINKDQAKIPELMQQFRDLYTNESSYYNDLSPIVKNTAGYHYSRSFIAFQGLVEYFKKEQIRNKKSIKQLTTNNLKMILQIWNEINGLKFACKNMQEGNILVEKNLKWNLTQELKVKLVGFNSATCSKWEMIEDIHTIFERQLGQKLYSEFRNKFKL